MVRLMTCGLAIDITDLSLPGGAWLTSALQDSQILDMLFDPYRPWEQKYNPFAGGYG